MLLLLLLLLSNTLCVVVSNTQCGFFVCITHCVFGSVRNTLCVSFCLKLSVCEFLSITRCVSFCL